MTTLTRVRLQAVDPTAAALSPRFVQLRPISTSATCTVMEGLDLEAGGRRVAVKFPSDTPWAIEAIAREARILTEIGPHPHILALLERVFLNDGRPALVLERCAGSLREAADGDSFSVRSVLATGIKLARALEAVHAAGYLHTEVRPANIYLTAEGEPVLAGFDEAMPAKPLPRHALHTTTRYTSPELLVGAPATAATDVYGLAVTLFELLGGRPALPGYRDEAPGETGLRILRGVHPPLPPHVPRELAELLSWAMTVDPANRPPSPAWLAEELRRVRAHVGPRPVH